MLEERKISLLTMDLLLGRIEGESLLIQALA